MASQPRAVTGAGSDCAVLHDYFAVHDGGGRVALLLARELGVPLVTGSVARGLGLERSWPEVRMVRLRSPVGNPLLRIAQQVRLWRTHQVTRSCAIYSGIYAPLAALNQGSGRRFYYCHSPPRYVYDQRDFWFGELPRALRPAAARFVNWFRPRYEEAVHTMSTIVVNSENVRRRMRRYLDVDATVVYPPCEVNAYEWRPGADYYLSTARLDRIKRVDRIIDAFLAMPGRRLVVTSDGPDRARLEHQARGASNISFTGPVSDVHLRRLLSECIATVYIPVDEDFGMSPVESMAAGKPVIGVAEGGLLETVRHQSTGFLIPPEAEVGAIVDAVIVMTPSAAESMRSACIAQAHRFSLSRFCATVSRILGDDYIL